jgi:hypothetical protein
LRVALLVLKQPGMRSWFALLLAVVVAACGDDGAGDGDGGPGPDAGVDLSAPYFDPDHIVEVEIDLPAEDWDALRVQTRSVSELFGTCLQEPFADPFTYFPATVTVDGETLEDVGVRKKGFLGSLSTEKPSLKIKFNEYVSGQRLAGMKGLTLNNSRQDPSFLRQCLTYQTFTAAGVPASRCNFARVTVNGEDLGLFVHVEGGNKDFLERHFDDPEGNLYEGTLSDFRAGWTATFELKTNETANDRTDLDPVIAALEQPDGAVLAALEPVVDVDQFLTFWAAEILTTHWDGYTGNANNFFAYHDPSTDKFSFFPWGADGTFIAGNDPFGGTPSSVQAVSLLPRRLYLLPETRDRYLERLEELLAGVWDEDAMLDEIDRMEGLITPIAGGSGTDLAINIDAVRDFVRDRRGMIETELAAGPPVWDAPLREPPCFVTIGNLDGTVSTTWGTIGAPNPFLTGTGTLAGELEGATLVVNQVGATSGNDTNADPPRSQLAQIAQLGDGTALVVIFQINPARFQPGTLAIDWNDVLGVVYRYVPVTQSFELVGLFSEGTLTLSQASMINGQPITASFSGTVIRSPF